MIALLLLVSALVLLIAFVCSLMESVLLSLNPLWLQVQQSHAKGEKTAGRWLALKQRIERPISVILVFNTLASVGLATLAGAIFARVFGEQWLWLFSVVLTVLVLFGGELLPKVLGVYHAQRLSSLLIGPLSVMLKICHPLVLLMERFCELIKPPQRNGEDPSSHIMAIITLTQAARAERALQGREELIIIHAATLSARRVSSAMVPREVVRTFDQRLSLEENVCRAGAHLHRSYPVGAEGSLSEVVGYIRVRELFVQNLLTPESANWHQLIRPVLRVREKSTLTQLLALFLEKHEIAALVENSAGQITGWITLDDVTQVIMGARV
jgi:CBS domain containing-hemolysin-like protein